MDSRARTQLALGLFLIMIAAFLAALRFYPPLALVHKSPSFGRKWGDLPDSGFSTWL